MWTWTITAAGKLGTLKPVRFHPQAKAKMMAGYYEG